jgi:hypothetical protein
MVGLKLMALWNLLNSTRTTSASSRSTSSAIRDACGHKDGSTGSTEAVQRQYRGSTEAVQRQYRGSTEAVNRQYSTRVGYEQVPCVHEPVACVVVKREGVGE